MSTQLETPTTHAVRAILALMIGGVGTYFLTMILGEQAIIFGIISIYLVLHQGYLGYKSAAYETYYQARMAEAMARPNNLGMPVEEAWADSSELDRHKML